MGDGEVGKEHPTLFLVWSSHNKIVVFVKVKPIKIVQSTGDGRYLNHISSQIKSPERVNFPSDKVVRRVVSR